MSDDRSPRGEMWWIRSDLPMPWAGLRIARFAAEPNPTGRTIFSILDELPYRRGLRDWESVSKAEGWIKVQRIPVPER